MVLRKADKKDIDLIFNWANEKLCRANSISEKSISIEEHSKWFNEKLQDKSCEFYIMEINNIPVGQVRIDVKNNAGKISYSLDKKYRGQGYGSIIISLLENRVIEQKLCSSLIAVVKSGNIASRHIFESKGYKQLLNDGDTLLYSKDKLKPTDIDRINNIPGGDFDINK